MRPRPPITLWRHILVEQGRLIAVTTGIVALVVSFAAAIKPIADGNLDPLDAPRFMMYAMIPMLAYVLPFAGGFGTTLAYHRLAQDNEALAAFAGGISHRSVLLPALVSGLILALTLLALNEQVIPRFLRSMEQMVTRDLARLVVRSVEQGRAVPFGDSVIYADAAQALGPDEDAGAYERIILRGVAFIETSDRRDDETIDLKLELFTSRATIWLFHGAEIARRAGTEAREGTLALIRLGDAVLRRAGDRTMVRVSERLEIGPTFLPGAFSNDPKFLTWRELHELPSHPDRMEFIGWRKRELAYELALVETFEAIRSELREGGRVRLRRPLGEPIYLEGTDIAGREFGWEVIPPAEGPIEVMVLRDGRGDTRSVTRWQAADAVLRPIREPSRQERRLELELELHGARVVSGTDDGGQGERESLVFGSLVLPEVDPAALASMDLDELLARVDAQLASIGPRRGEALRAKRNELLHRIERLRREVLSKRHERLAMSLSCLVMVLTGAVVALRLRYATPLVVYLWSFFPALAALITINGGQQLVHRAGEAGLPLLWGGNLALMLYTLIAYRGLARH